MADDLTRRGPEDPKKININQPWEVRYWCDALNVSEALLREAVEKAGVYVVDVKRYLTGR